MDQLFAKEGEESYHRLATCVALRIPGLPRAGDVNKFATKFNELAERGLISGGVMCDAFVLYLGHAECALVVFPTTSHDLRRLIDEDPAFILMDGEPRAW